MEACEAVGVFEEDDKDTDFVEEVEALVSSEARWLVRFSHRASSPLVEATLCWSKSSITSSMQLSLSLSLRIKSMLPRQLRFAGMMVMNDSSLSTLLMKKAKEELC